MNAVIFLINTVTELYMLTFLLRIILQWVRADFYNPLSQFIFQATRPLVTPVRKLVPATGSLDLATLIVLIVLQCLVTWLLLTLAGASVTPLTFVTIVAIRLTRLVLWFYTVAIFIYVILSWISPQGPNPMASILSAVVNPILMPVRRILPLMGGFDLSPLIVLIAIQFLMRLLPGLPVYLM